MNHRFSNYLFIKTTNYHQHNHLLYSDISCCANTGHDLLESLV